MSGSSMDFEFVTDKESAVQILKMWNIRLLESIPCNPQQLNEISSSLTAASGGKKSKRSSRSFRDKHMHMIDPTENSDPIQRAGSFSRIASYGTNVTLGGVGLSQGSVVSHPLPRNHRDSRGRSWTEAGDQDTFFTPIRFSSGRMSTSPPPLPSRPVESSSDEDDPDYAYIDEREVIGPKGQQQHQSLRRDPTSELDDQLEDLKRSIVRENKAKRKEAEKRKTHTLQPRPRPSGTLRLSPRFFPTEPEDYLEPIPSKRVQTQSTSSDGYREPHEIQAAHARSVSEPYFKGMQNLYPPRFDDEHSPNTQDLSPCSSESSPVFNTNPPALPPRTWRSSDIESYHSSSSANSENTAPVKTGSASLSGSERMYGVNENMGKTDAKFSSPPPTEQNVNLLENHKHYTTPSEQTSHVTTAPPLPPRSPTKDRVRLSRNSSSSSLSSSSSSHRCPRCRSLRKSKSTVSKTFSLDQRTPHLSKEESRKSLPNLESTVEDVIMRRRSVHHHQRCSKCSQDSSTDQLASNSNTSLPSSSSQKNLEYLQLVGEESQPAPVDSELKPELDLLSSCLQSLEYLTNKVNQDNYTSVSTASSSSSTTKPPSGNSSSLTTKPPSGNSSSSTTKPKSRNPYDHIKLKPSSDLKSVQTDLDAAVRQTQLAQAELSGASNHRNHTVNRHRPLTLGRHHSSTAISVASPPPSAVLSQGGYSSPAPSGVLSQGGYSSNTIPSPRSKSSMGVSPSAPPVPPRSSVSLTQPTQIESAMYRPVMNGTVISGATSASRKAQSLGRHSTLQKFRDPIPPPRSKSVLENGPGYHSNMRSRVSQYGGHVEPENSSTVFIHHLKDRRLAHMV